MAGNTECCGWASWGELAGMGNGRIVVDDWGGAERPSAMRSREEASETIPISLVDRSHRVPARESAPRSGTSAARWRSGHRARAHLATLRRRLRERNKHV